MPAAKRKWPSAFDISVANSSTGKADGPVEVAISKKLRCTEATLTADQLGAMTNEELINSIKILQQALRDSQTLAETSANASKQPITESWSPEKISERAKKVRELCNKEIKKQMKWQPSCKKGSTRWSYTGIVPNGDVFYAAFNFDKGAKPFKTRKVTMQDFQDIFGYISASCRYNDLSVTGEHVNLRWDAEELTFQLSGTYGI